MATRERTSTPNDLVIRAEPEDTEAIEELADALDHDEWPKQPVSLMVGDRRANMPAAVEAALERIVEYLRAGLAVTIDPYDDVLTTQEAADLLKVSRPHLVKLLDQGEISSLPSTGTHRRISLNELLAYRARRLAAMGAQEAVRT